MTGTIDLPKLASAYRRLVLWFGAQLIVSFGSFGALALLPQLGAGLETVVLSFAIPVGTLATIVALAYYGYQTATALGSNVAWVWAWVWGLAMFVPCANAIALLVLSSKATAACRANGIPVGILGPRITAGERAADDAFA